MALPRLQLEAFRQSRHISLLVRQGHHAQTGERRSSTTLMWTDLLEAATNMPSPVSAAMSRRTMPSMWANGTDPDVFLRQERIKKALPRNRLREWLELPRCMW